MAEQSYERGVLDEVGQMRLFLGSPRATSSISDNALAIAVWILAAALGLVQLMLYSRTVLIVLAAVVVRVAWMGMFSRAR